MPAADVVQKLRTLKSSLLRGPMKLGFNLLKKSMLSETKSSVLLMGLGLSDVDEDVLLSASAQLGLFQSELEEALEEEPDAKATYGDELASLQLAVQVLGHLVDLIVAEHAGK